MSYLVLKSLHIISMVTWFAALFYLPRLFVYHSMITKNGETTDQQGHDRFCIMEKKLNMMGHIGMGATWLFGLWLMFAYLPGGGWIHLKLLFVLALVGYQIWCGRIRKGFAKMENTKSDKFYRWFNEAPVIVLVAAVFLAVTKPF